MFIFAQLHHNPECFLFLLSLRVWCQSFNTLPPLEPRPAQSVEDQVSPLTKVRALCILSECSRGTCRPTSHCAFCG